MSAKRGFLLMNTGSPEAPTKEAVHEFIKYFEHETAFQRLRPLYFMEQDGLVQSHDLQQEVEIYESIWSEQGSPLIHYCTTLAEQLKPKVDGPLEMAMAYGRPSFKDAIDRLMETGVDELCLLPMFPQYAKATVGACVKKTKHELHHRRSNAIMRVAPPFYSEAAFIESWAEAIRDADEYILFSYHGYPLNHVTMTDPTEAHCLKSAQCCGTCSVAHDTCYRHQCFATSHEIAKAANIPDERWTTTFESHYSLTKRMTPTTHETLVKLADQGIKAVAVVCPASFCDDIETLDEIAVRRRITFWEAGGESYRVIPCLNDSPAALRCLETLMSKADQWPVTPME